MQTAVTRLTDKKALKQHRENKIKNYSFLHKYKNKIMKDSKFETMNKKGITSRMSQDHKKLQETLQIYRK